MIQITISAVKECRSFGQSVTFIKAVKITHTNLRDVQLRSGLSGAEAEPRSNISAYWETKTIKLFREAPIFP